MSLVKHDMKSVELEKYQGTSHVSLDTMNDQYEGHNDLPTLSGLGKFFGETIAKYIRIIIVVVILIIAIVVVVKFHRRCTKCRPRVPVQEPNREISINIPPIEPHHPYERVQQDSLEMTSLNRAASSSDILNGEDREGHHDRNQDGSTDYVTMEENSPCGGTLGSLGPEDGWSGRPGPER